jgi:hypothetical protein
MDASLNMRLRAGEVKEVGGISSKMLRELTE